MRSSIVRICLMLLGLLGVVVSITILFLGMRAVMDVGGYCAEGGPYQIAVHCPKGVAWMIPLSIFVGLGSAGLYVFNTFSGGPNITLLFWSGLFGSLGWNFLEYGLRPPLDISWLICGTVFEIMALGPVIFLGRIGLTEMVRGSMSIGISLNSGRETSRISSGLRKVVLLVHLMIILSGIFLASLVYQWAAY